MRGRDLRRVPGRTESLIPLYAVGVFLALTMSQAGMVVHWWRHREDSRWRRRLMFNALGGGLSALVFLTAAVTKFTAGAWVALVTVGVFVLVALRVRRRYDVVGEAITLRPHSTELPRRGVAPAVDGQADGDRSDASRRARVAGRRPAAGTVETEELPVEIHHLFVVPVAGLDLPAMRALAYAASLQQPVLALHVSPTQGEAERFREYWHIWGDHLPLEVIVSPYRAIVAPLVNYIDSLHDQRRDLTLTVTLPEIVVRHWWQRILHNQTAPRLRRAFRPLPKVVVTSIPFHVLD